MRSQYHSLYLLKAIGVLFVLMIHFSCYKIQYFEPLYRCGVPLFYIISGFFLYAKDESVQIQKVKRSIVKIVKLILFFKHCICDPTMGGGKMLHITTVGKLHSGNIYYWQFFPYYLFITNMIPKDILQNVELPIMVVVLLIWSYGINWSMNLLTKHRLQQ